MKAMFNLQPNRLLALSISALLLINIRAGADTPVVRTLVEAIPNTASVLPTGITADQKSSLSLKAILVDSEIELEKIKKALGPQGIIASTRLMHKAKNSSDPRAKIAFIQSQMEALKQKIFNKKLGAFDLKAQLFHQGAMSLSSYIVLLTETKNPLFVSKQSFPQIALFKELKSREANLNFEAIEAERSAVIRRLVHRLPIDDQRKLRKTALDYRLKNINHRDFYSYLKKSCQHSGIKLEAYPQLKSYIDYVLAAGQIDQISLGNEVSQLETTRYAEVSKNKLELTLAKKSLEITKVTKQMDSDKQSGSLVWSQN